MRTEEVEVTIDPEGRVKLSVRGVKGKGCVDVTSALEEALGADVESRTYTSEYYESESAQQRLPGIIRGR